MTKTRVTAQPRPAAFLRECWHLLDVSRPDLPVLDLACGEGHNGVFLALQGFRVVCCDRSRKALERAAELARNCGVTVETWLVDLERGGRSPLPADAFGAVTVFRYLHRPLFPCIRKAVCAGGFVFYETYTREQGLLFGKPKNPDYLLEPGELREWFRDWEILRYEEGLFHQPRRAAARILCRNPGGGRRTMESPEQCGGGRCQRAPAE